MWRKVLDDRFWKSVLARNNIFRLCGYHCRYVAQLKQTNMYLMTQFSWTSKDSVIKVYRSHFAFFQILTTTYALETGVTLPTFSVYSLRQQSRNKGEFLNIIALASTYIIFLWCEIKKSFCHSIRQNSFSSSIQIVLTAIKLSFEYE